MTIVHISDDIKKEFKIDSTGKAIVSIRGAARIAGVSDTALRSNLKFKGANLSVSKMAEMLVDAGFEGANFSSFSKQGIPDTALATILEYYAHDAKENCTQQAKLACRAYAAIGIRTWIQNELGYQKQEQHDRPNLDTFTIYDLKPWQIERLVAAIECRKENESIPAAYFEGMENFDESVWEIPFEVIDWLHSLHQDLIEEFTYRKCLESNNLSSNNVLQDYVRRFEADAAIRDYSQIRDMAKVIAPFEKIQLVEKELTKSNLVPSKSKGFGKSKKQGGCK
jgi:hypothetical protein